MRHWFLGPIPDCSILIQQAHSLPELVDCLMVTAKSQQMRMGNPLELELLGVSVSFCGVRQFKIWACCLNIQPSSNSTINDIRPADSIKAVSGFHLSPVAKFHTHTRLTDWEETSSIMCTLLLLLIFLRPDSCIQKKGIHSGMWPNVKKVLQVWCS